MSPATICSTRVACAAIASVCVLWFGDATVAQERTGLYVPHNGMQFTTAFTNDFGKDAESLTTITSVTDSIVSLEYSSSRGLSVRRDLLMSDRRSATSYVLGYEADMPNVIEGTTSLGVSERVLKELQSTGNAHLTLIYSPRLAGIECNLTRIAASVMMSVIVEDRVVGIPALHARAQCADGDRSAWGEFYFANNLSQPLMIQSMITFSWERRPRTERITRIIDGRGLSPEMEQSLSTIGKYDAYGIRFDFDSADLRPESYQLVQEIAQMLRRNPEWRIAIVGHTDSIGDPDYNLGLSDRRAETVRLQLSNGGVDGSRLQSEGRGQAQPKADNDTLAGRAINRRVEFRRLDRRPAG